jgi:hypothetical protein
MLRQVYHSQEYDCAKKVEALAEKEIEQIGLEPYEARDPLPPIEREDVYLVAWMAFEAE